MRAEEAQARESGAMRQEPGRNLGDGARGAEAGSSATGKRKAEEPSLMEAVVDRSNLWLAYQAVRVVDIPKPAGGVRTLGIPTVLDRLIQQALHQVLQPIFEPGFSESSYGFRPQGTAQQAVLAAQRYVQEGRRWGVDIDLSKFFDRVNHDILMARVARQVNGTSGRSSCGGSGFSRHRFGVKRIQIGV